MIHFILVKCLQFCFDKILSTGGHHRTKRRELLGCWRNSSPFLLFLPLSGLRRSCCRVVHGPEASYVSFVLIIMFLCTVLFEVISCSEGVFKTHYLMFSFLLVKALSLFFHAVCTFKIYFAAQALYLIILQIITFSYRSTSIS